MATYTLSYTGAQVNTAIGNATNLYNGAHTWTATQTHTGNIVGSSGATIDFPVIAGASGTFQSLVIEGGSARVDIDATGGLYDAGAFQVASTGSFTVNCASAFNDDVSIDGDVSIVNGSLTCDSTAYMSSDLSVSGDLTLSGELDVTGTAYMAGHLYLDNDLTVTNGKIVGGYKATDDVDMDGYGIANATSIGAQWVTLQGEIEISYSGDSGIASAGYAGCYISTSGITPFAVGATIPANVLVIQFHH